MPIEMIEEFNIGTPEVATHSLRRGRRDRVPRAVPCRLRSVPRLADEAGVVAGEQHATGHDHGDDGDRPFEDRSRWEKRHAHARSRHGRARSRCRPAAGGARCSSARGKVRRADAASRAASFPASRAERRRRRAAGARGEYSASGRGGRRGSWSDEIRRSAFNAAASGARSECVQLLASAVVAPVDGVDSLELQASRWTDRRGQGSRHLCKRWHRDDLHGHGGSLRGNAGWRLRIRAFQDGEGSQLRWTAGRRRLHVPHQQVIAAGPEVGKK